MKNANTLSTFLLSVIVLVCGIVAVEAQIMENNSIRCADGIDNDGNGLIDCEEPACQNLPGMGCSICTDGISFADTVLAYQSGCTTSDPEPEGALGVSDYPPGNEAFAFLGEGGFIKLGFTNNLLTNSGNASQDLWIFEVGPVIESSNIALRPADAFTLAAMQTLGLPDTNMDGYYEVGTISGSTYGVDIDNIMPNYQAGQLSFDAVEITDIPSQSCFASPSSPGADIDAVCALSSIPVDCAGTPNGTAVIDSCGLCLEPTDPNFNQSCVIVCKAPDSNSFCVRLKACPQGAPSVIDWADATLATSYMFHGAHDCGGFECPPMLNRNLSMSGFTYPTGAPNFYPVFITLTTVCPDGSMLTTGPFQYTLSTLNCATCPPPPCPGDVTSPQAVCQDITVQLDPGGNGSTTPATVNNGSTDNCSASSNLTLSLNNSTFDCADVGSPNYALDFDGTNDFVYLNAIAINTNKVTLEAWVNLDQAVSQQSGSIGGIFDSGPDAFVLYAQKSVNEIRFKVTDSNGTAERPGISGNLLTVGSWHHIAGVYDGATGTAKTYLDGSLIDTHSNPALVDNVAASGIIGIGAQNNPSPSSFFNGQIDEVRVWNVARTQAQLQADMSEKLQGNEPGLVAYYPLNDGTGSSTAMDYSVNTNNGTLTNMTPASDWIMPGAPNTGAGGEIVTLTVTDENGNSSTCQASVSVIDNACGSSQGTGPFDSGHTLYSLKSKHQNVSVQTDFNIRLFPNPAAEHLNIDLLFELEAGTLLEVIDIRGQLIRSMQIRDRYVPLDLRELPNGNYMLRIRSGSVHIARRFVRLSHN